MGGLEMDKYREAYIFTKNVMIVSLLTLTIIAIVFEYLVKVSWIANTAYMGTVITAGPAITLSAFSFVVKYIENDEKQDEKQGSKDDSNHS